MGLEPTTFGITIRRSNQLSYIYRVVFWRCKDNSLPKLCKVFSQKMIVLVPLLRLSSAV